MKFKLSPARRILSRFGGKGANTVDLKRVESANVYDDDVIDCFPHPSGLVITAVLWMFHAGSRKRAFERNGISRIHSDV